VPFGRKKPKAAFRRLPSFYYPVFLVPKPSGVSPRIPGLLVAFAAYR